MIGVNSRKDVYTLHKTKTAIKVPAVPTPTAAVITHATMHAHLVCIW